MEILAPSSQETSSGSLPPLDSPTNLTLTNRAASVLPAISHLLSPEERIDYALQEGRIEKAYRQFLIEAGVALTVIQSRKLYRADHPNFENYCVVRWGIHHSQAYRLIAAAKVFAILARAPSPVGDNQLPTHERQVRCLAGKPPEVILAAWQIALAQAGSATRVQGWMAEDALRELNGRQDKTPRKHANPKDFFETVLVVDIEQALTSARQGDIDTAERKLRLAILRLEQIRRKEVLSLEATRAES